MSGMINIGIDLGTTNSVIARFVQGEVRVIKNPVSWKETLPSVVAFKRDRIIVGDKAKEYLEKDPKNVIGTFKRKMGTSESYPISALNQSKTPVDLSAQVLKELKTFIQEETVNAAVITIPASFDTIQSNATKEAGHQAGLEQVILIQEPIAASLAYANDSAADLSSGKWLVYDLGGGTFDVALISIDDGEMKVVDHEGDNFLGGADFDGLIVDHLVIPHLESKYNFTHLKKEMKSAAGKHNGKYYVALNKAEGAKIQLSTRTNAEIEFEIEDDNGIEVDCYLNVTRSEFEGLIKPFVDHTIDMIKEILTRNALTRTDVDFILMVGGSTYIPFVRQRVGEVLEIDVNTDIDPSTAVGVGAAFYAGTKEKKVAAASGGAPSEEGESIPQDDGRGLSIKMAYSRTSQDDEEFFVAKFSGNFEGLSYRITREDGGFDSGTKTVKEKISEELPLVGNSYNFFKLSVYDEQNNPVSVKNLDLIGIAHGKYNVAGQPLPHDICLEVDDLIRKATKLEAIIQKNAILPLKRTITKEINRTIVKGSGDEFTINVLEGPSTALPEANQTIGFMTISGKQLSRDLIKGADVEITFSMSESRDLTISAYIPMTDQEFTEIFKPSQRHLPIDRLREEVSLLKDQLDQEWKDAEEREDYETAGALKKLTYEMDELFRESSRISEDDVTDARYQLEDRKRKLAQTLDTTTRETRIKKLHKEYQEEKKAATEIVEANGNDYERKVLDDIIAQEEVFLNSKNLLKIEEKIEDLRALTNTILWRKPDFMKEVFYTLAQNSYRFNDQTQARDLIDSGHQAISQSNWDRLRDVISRLLSLLPRSVQSEMIAKGGTGLS